MTVSLGYTVATLNDLKALPTEELLTGYKKEVISFKSDYIYDSSSTEEADDINIIIPNSNVGRWYRAYQNILDSNRRLQSPITNEFLLNTQISVNEDFTTNFNMCKVYILLEVTCITPIRIRFYINNTYRLNDLDRAIGVLPIGDVGVLFEGITSLSQTTINLNPIVLGRCLTSDIPVTITNLSGFSTSALSVIITYIPLI